MTTPVRLAHVDDHETVQLGLGALLEGEPDLRLVVSGGSVDDIADRLHEVDLVVLDLRLSDGSSVTDNVERLRDGGVDVVAFTAADDPAELRTASRAGVLAVIRKSEDRATILDALRRAGAGEVVATTEWAAALDGDPELASARLSPKEREVLALYASGDKSAAVAARTGLSVPTVAEYIRRIRVKYAIAGRPAHTKIDLYKRAVEDGVLPGPS